LQVQELTELSEKQRQKIQAHLDNFGSEQESLKKLIIEYLTYVKYKKEESDTDDYFEKLQEYEDNYQKTRDALKDKLDKSEMVKVQRILKDCEKLVEQEQEIEVSLDNKSQLIEEQKQKLASQTGDSEEKEKLEEQEKTNEKQRERQNLY